jgi:23S rRNA pseudouridine2605 synthase
VSRLKRVRFGSFFIPSAVKAGRWMEIPPKEVKDLYTMAGMGPRKRR